MFAIVLVTGICDKHSMLKRSVDVDVAILYHNYGTPAALNLYCLEKTIGLVTMVQLGNFGELYRYDMRQSVQLLSVWPYCTIIIGHRRLWHCLLRGF